MTRALQRGAALGLFALCLSAAAVATEFPQPPALKADVAFWVYVYSRLSTREGVIHDSRNLKVIYEKQANLPPELSSERRDLLRARARYYQERLLRLSGANAKPADAEDRRILALWKGHTTPRELRLAAANVRFQAGQSDRFREGFERAGAWRPQIEQLLTKAGLPVELAALPYVESAFNPSAYSKAGAAGMWQLMPAVARRFIRVDAQVDERLDPFASTQAAMAYFQDAHERLGNWPLAVVSYNHGVGGMERAKRQLGTTDIVSVLRRYQGPAFKFASRNFYPSFLAVLELESRAAQLFTEVQPVAPWQTCRAPLRREIPSARLALSLGIPLDRLQAYNPALRPSIWGGTAPIPAGYTLRLPAQSFSRIQAPETLSATGSWQAEFSIPQPFHVVAPGDTLKRIATTYGRRAKELAALNNLSRRSTLTVGQRIALPYTGVQCPGAAASTAVAQTDRATTASF